MTWITDTTYAEAAMNKGTLLKKFNKGVKPRITDAQVYKSVLWANKPKFFWSFLIKFKNYHIADFNLYYANVRKNAQLRVATFTDAPIQAPESEITDKSCNQRITN